MEITNVGMKKYWFRQTRGWVHYKV